MSGDSVAWIVKLVSIGAAGAERSTEVMRIARPDDLTDLATLGLTMAEGKQLLAGVQQELVAAQARRAAAVARPTGSRIIVSTRLPRCSARSPSGCPATAVLDAG